MFYKTLSITALLVTQSEAINFRPYAGTNPWHKPATTSTWVNPDWDVNYKVPNFGMDIDMSRSKHSIADAESKLGKWEPFTSKSIEVGPHNFNNRPANIH